MGLEIERKFLVTGDGWRGRGEVLEIRQGYLAREGACVVRVRVAGERAWLTVKGRTVGISRPEYEVKIPVCEALEMLENLCLKPLMEKRRTRLESGGLIWEVDEFLGENAGLIVAEVELTTPDQPVPLPDWVGQEVSGDPRYFNSNLLIHPFTRWTP